MNPSDLIALANRLPYLEYSGPAFQKVQAQFPGAVGKDAADHVIDCIAQLRAENAKLREALTKIAYLKPGVHGVCEPGQTLYAPTVQGIAEAALKT